MRDRLRVGVGVGIRVGIRVQARARFRASVRVRALGSDPECDEAVAAQRAEVGGASQLSKKVSKQVSK